MNVIDYKMKFKEINNRITSEDNDTEWKKFYKLREWIWHGKKQIK